MVEVRQEAPRQAEVLALLAASDAFSQALYPPESNHLLDVDSLEQPEVRFFVARLAGAAVGCGAVVLAGDGSAEVKRMFVAEAARGSGAGAAILAAVEECAAAARVGVLRLETGIHNSAALRLYRGRGYVERGPFGLYGEDPLSVFMERRLAG